MSTRQGIRPRRRLAVRIGGMITAAALCFGSFAALSPSAGAASVNDSITSGKVYRIINLGSGKYLNVTGGRDQDNINVNQYTGDGTNTQDFIIRWVAAESCYKIYPVCSSNGSGRVLHIARSGSAPANGGNAVIKTASSADAASQRFQIDTVGHNLFTIRPTSNTSLYLTANGDTNGTWTGTGTNTAGNVAAKTLSTGNLGSKRYQKWIIVEKTRYANYAVQFPFAEYTHGNYYTKSGSACVKYNSCISFWGGQQGVAFSREVYARSFGGFRWSDANATGGELASFGSDNSALKTYLKNKVGIGGHVMAMHKSSSSLHSLIIANFNNTKLWVYDASISDTCQIRSRWYTYAEFAAMYSSIKYSHKGLHTHRYDTYIKINEQQHAKFCTTCNLSAYDTATLDTHSFIATSGGKKCTQCHYIVRNYEQQDVSSPEEGDAAFEPEELVLPAEGDGGSAAAPSAEVPGSGGAAEGTNGAPAAEPALLPEKE